MISMKNLTDESFRVYLFHDLMGILKTEVFIAKSINTYGFFTRSKDNDFK